MRNLASNNHGVEESETEDTSLLQCFAGQFSQSQLPAVHLKASRVVMYTMNNHTTRCNSVTAGLTKHCI